MHENRVVKYYLDAPKSDNVFLMHCTGYTATFAMGLLTFPDGIDEGQVNRVGVATISDSTTVNPTMRLQEWDGGNDNHLGSAFQE